MQPKTTTTRTLAILGFCGAMAAASAPASAACYFIYGAKNELLYRSTTAPVDLSKPISQSVRSRFAGGHLTMVPDESGCPDLAQYGPADLLQSSAREGSPIEASPLFRNIESRSAFGSDSYQTTTKSTPGSGARR